MDRALQQAVADVLYREMTLADIPGGLALCRAARWNQLEPDWRVFLEASPGGCRVAERNGNIVGTIATLPFGGRFSWVSMVLVDPAERGAGIGTRLIGEALDFLRDELCIRLDATPAGLPLYKRNGFIEEYGISRMTTVVEEARFRQAPGIRPMTMDDFPDVLSLDVVAFGADRAFLLRNLFGRDRQYAWVAFDGPEIAGYIFGRRGFLFDHLGPVVARDIEIARRLTSACLRAAHGAKVGLDIPRRDASWTGWLEQMGFVEERSLLRMFRGENRYPGRVSDVYAIVGPEFG